jgi:oligopeptide/dipeptide ABC transporter ATP-binding protein
LCPTAHHVGGIAVAGPGAELEHVLLAFPWLLIAIMLVAVFGQGVWNVIAAIAFGYIDDFARLARGEVPRIDGDGRRAERTGLGGEPPSATNPPSGCRFHPRCPEFIDGSCPGRKPSLQDVPGDAGHEAACHWLGRSEAERAAHTPPSPTERGIIRSESADD